VKTGFDLLIAAYFNFVMEQNVSAKKQV